MLTLHLFLLSVTPKGHCHIQSVTQRFDFVFVVWFSPFQANLCFVDIDNHYIELPEDFPHFPNKTEFIQELSDVLLSFGISANTGAPPWTRSSPLSTPGSTPSTPGRERKTVALRQLEDDGRNGNLAGEELAVLELLQGNATLERLQALTKRTGVTVARVDALRAGVKAQSTEGQGGWTAAEEEELKNAKLNVQLREVFASRFTTMFADYEAFVIQSAPDLESWLTNREQMHNFDKVTKSDTRTQFFLEQCFSQFFHHSAQKGFFLRCSVLSVRSEKRETQRGYLNYFMKARPDCVTLEN